MNDTEIVNWISENPHRRIFQLGLNFDSGFCAGLSFREMVEKVVNWENENR